MLYLPQQMLIQMQHQSEFQHGSLSSPSVVACIPKIQTLPLQLSFKQKISLFNKVYFIYFSSTLIQVFKSALIRYYSTNLYSWPSKPIRIHSTILSQVFYVSQLLCGMVIVSQPLGGMVIVTQPLGGMVMLSQPLGGMVIGVHNLY